VRSSTTGSEDFDNTGYVVAKKVALAETLSKDADDEAMNKWKASLLGGPAPGASASSSADAGASSTAPANPTVAEDPRRVVFEELILSSPGRPDAVFPLSSPALVESFVKKGLHVMEGATFNLKMKFRPQHDVLLGLSHSRVVTRKGFKLDKSKFMMGSYAPWKSVEFVWPEEVAPSGMLGRGDYVVKSTFIDDDGVTHLSYEVPMVVAKTW
jgi:Rho GDP-dissociation inhibitor